MTHRHAVLFQHLPAHAKDQPEQRQFFTERPQQIADVELHSEQNQTHSQNNQAHRQRTDQVDKDRFWCVELAVVTQGIHSGSQFLLIRFQPAQTPVDQPGNQQQRQTGEESDKNGRPGFFPVHRDFHRLKFIFQALRERFDPVPVHWTVTVHPKDLLSQDGFQVFRHTH